MGLFAAATKQDMLRTKFGTTSPATKPANWYLALSRTAPYRNETTGVIEGITEFSGSGYSRITIANNNTNWVIDDDSATLDTSFNWTPTATDTGTQPAYWVLYDAASVGTAQFFGVLDGSVNWVNGATITVTGITVSLPDA